VERLSDKERERLGELLAEGAPAWRMHQEVHRSRWAIRRAINGLQRPPGREPRRSPLRLSLVEREEISRGLAAGESLRVIAKRLGRSPSTVSREVAAQGGRRRYRAARADVAAVRGMRRPKPSKLAGNVELRAIVEAKLELRWSPAQIAGWLGENFPDDPEMRVSHETIYLSLFVQSKGALRKELTRFLRTGRANRRPLGHSVMNGQGQLRGTVNISERPAEANDRAVPGHGEGDLIFGKAMSAIATLVERKTRFVMLIQLPNGHTADVVAEALAAKIVELPHQLRRPITTRARRWPSTRGSASPPACPSTSAIPAAPGSADRTRTPTACCASTSPSAATSRSTPKLTSTPSLTSSTDDLDKHSTGRHHQRHSTKPLR
jgi:IS30 family transposase